MSSWFFASLWANRHNTEYTTFDKETWKPTLHKSLQKSELPQDCYFCIGYVSSIYDTPYDERQTTRSRTKDVQINYRPYVVIDIDIRQNYHEDTKQTISHETLEAHIKKIQQHLDHTPLLKEYSYIVNSGNWCHIYYLGKRDYNITTYKNATQWLYELYDCNVPHEYRCDRSTFNPARLFRLPNTINTSCQSKWWLDPQLCTIVEQTTITQCSFFDSIQELADEWAEWVKKNDEAKQKALKEMMQQRASKKKELTNQPDNNLYDLINSIDPYEFAQIIKSTYWFKSIKESKHKINFQSPKDNKNTGLFLDVDTNILVNTWTHYLKSNRPWYTPFTFVKYEHDLTAKEVFVYYIARFPHVAEADAENKREYVKHKRDERKRELEKATQERNQAHIQEIHEQVRENKNNNHHKPQKALPSPSSSSTTTLILNEKLDTPRLKKEFNLIDETSNLLKQITIATYRRMVFVFNDQKSTYTYTDDEVIESIIETHLTNKYDNISSSRTKSILESAKRLAFDSKAETLISPPLDRVVFSDCIYNPRTKSHSKITAQDYISTTLPYTLQQTIDAWPPRVFAAFLDHLLAKYQDKWAVKKTLQQYMWMCLLGAYSDHKFLMFYGEGGTWKGTFWKIFLRLLGERATTMDIHAVEKKSETDTSLLALMGKSLVCDLEAGNLRLDSTLLKTLAAGESVDIRKRYADGIKMNNTAKIILATNELPRVKNRDRSIKRRWIFIECINPVSKNDVITDFDKDMVDNEWPSILKWALEGLNEFLENNSKIAIAPEIQQEVDNYVDEQDVFLQYLLEKQDEWQLVAWSSSYVEDVYCDFSLRMKTQNQKAEYKLPVFGRYMTKYFDQFGLQWHRPRKRVMIDWKTKEIRKNAIMGIQI